MDFTDPIARTALVAAAAMLLMLLVARLRQRGPALRRQRRDALDTVNDWPPEAARVLTIDERQAYDLLRRALPAGFMVLAQVPLSRFLRVSARHSYADWLQRVGHLSADLLVCDTGSQVLMAIDIRANHESDRSRRRHERLGKVLRSAGIRVQVWREGELPSITDLRSLVAAALGQPEAAPASAGAMPLIPVPEMAEILHEGDLLDRSMEPVASGFYDDLEYEAAAASR